MKILSWFKGRNSKPAAQIEYKRVACSLERERDVIEIWEARGWSYDSTEHDGYEGGQLIVFARKKPALSEARDHFGFMSNP